MTAAELRTRFPEFGPTADATVTAALAAAELFVSDTWDADQAEEVIALKAASIIATSPVGRAAKLSDPKTGISAYDKRLRELYESHACCLSRVG